MTAKTALITGITGLERRPPGRARLLGLGYTVHGIKRRSSLFNTDDLAEAQWHELCRQEGFRVMGNGE